MEKKKMVLKIAVCGVVAVFAVAAVGCDSGLAGPGGQTGVNLAQFNYVFRVVDVSDTANGQPAIQMAASAQELQELAAIFYGINSPNTRGRSVDSDSVLAGLAQAAIMAYTNPDVLELLDTLAARGLYIKFAYKDFLLDQVVTPRRSIFGGAAYDTSLIRAFTFNGSSTDPSTWIPEYIQIQHISTPPGFGNAADIAAQEMTFAIAPDRLHIVEEYMQHFAELLLGSPDSVVTEQPDGSLVVIELLGNFSFRGASA